MFLLEYFILEYCIVGYSFDFQFIYNFKFVGNGFMIYFEEFCIIGIVLW